MRRKVAYFGLFIAVALIFSYVEHLIPVHYAVPGIKLGLANLCVMIVLYMYGVREAFILSMTRIALAGFMFGNLFTILYSMAGGILSLLVMWSLKRTKLFSMVGVSMAGGVFHNVGQLMVAAIVVESISVFYYLPILAFSGIVTGILIGVLANEMLRRMQKI